MIDSLMLLVFLQFCPKGGALELIPPSSEVLLQPNSSYSVVCSGWGGVVWRLPVGMPPDFNVSVTQQEGSRSVLQLHGASWRFSGNYVCQETTGENLQVDIFIPGAAPEEWFLPSASVVMKEGEEGTIPCQVSDPALSVSLLQRSDRTPVSGARYRPAHGFTAPLNDSSYICLAQGAGQRAESQSYYVFTILVPKPVQVQLTWSSKVLLQGDVLTVNCSVGDTHTVSFSWDFPRRQMFEPLTDILSNQTRSFINISMATPADSGVYVCRVTDTQQKQTVEKNISITVLERGYVRVIPAGGSISFLLQQDAELRLKVDAYPAPNITWSHYALPITTATTTHLADSRYVSVLSLGKVTMEQRGNYTATVANDDDITHATFTLEVIAPPRITQVEEMEGGLLCVTEGEPPPSVYWYTCSTHRCGVNGSSWISLTERGGVSVVENVTSIEERGVSQVTSLLVMKSLGSDTIVRCEAQNLGGHRVWDTRLVANSLWSQVALLTTVASLVVMVIIFLIMLVILWRKDPGYQASWKLLESDRQLPYKTEWEVPRDSLLLGGILGKGAFGRIVMATASGLSATGPTKVAVKMLKSTRGSSALLSEVKLLIHLGKHMNIVNLLGAVTSTGPVWMITEYSCHGDLSDYLQRNKHTFLQQDHSDSDGGYMDMSKEAGQYVAMEKLGESVSSEGIQACVYETHRSHHDQEKDLLLSESPLLTLQDLFSFSYQVAQGMDFLSARNCVHRDLAARNLLVCEGKLVKVGDLRLARDLHTDLAYISRGNDYLPVKWMSPESIFQCVYTVHSDVWSYGVLLWEIFSLGVTPYPDVKTQEFCCALKRGDRLTRPDHAPPTLYEVMMSCWREEPTDRPAFSLLVNVTGDLLTDSYKKRYVDLTQRFLERAGPADQSREGPSQSLQTENTTPSICAQQSDTEVIPITDVIIATSGQVLDTPTQQTDSLLPENNPVSSSQNASGALELTLDPRRKSGTKDFL